MISGVAASMLDSRVHLWDLTVCDQAWIPAGSPIRRTFGVADLRSVLAGNARGIYRAHCPQLTRPI